MSKDKRRFPLTPENKVWVAQSRLNILEQVVNLLPVKVQELLGRVFPQGMASVLAVTNLRLRLEEPRSILP